jgi:hypothetical protein
MFTKIRNNLYINSVAAIIEQYLKIQEKVGLLAYPEVKKPSAVHSLIIVDQFRKIAPSLFNTPSMRPNKVALAAAALAHAAETASDKFPGLKGAFRISLGNILSEISTHEATLSLNAFDRHLIDKAVKKLEEFASAEHEDLFAVDDAPSWEDWLARFKKVAGSVNAHLAETESGSLVDFMDIEPLKRAWRNGIESDELARKFAAQFDVHSFGKK